MRRGEWGQRRWGYQSRSSDKIQATFQDAGLSVALVGEIHTTGCGTRCTSALLRSALKVRDAELTDSSLPHDSRFLVRELLGHGTISGRAVDVVPLSPQTQSRLAALFALADREAARSILVSRCGRQLPFMAQASSEDLERIRFAALRLSKGRLRELQDAVALAETDWRDLLVAAGFADDPTAHLRWTP